MARPNVHTILHYENVATEYATPNNCTTLFLKTLENTPVDLEVSKNINVTISDFLFSGE